MKTNLITKSITFLSFIILFISTSYAQNIESEVDEILSSVYKSDGVGVSLLIAKDGKTIYRKAFGMANLELNAPMKPENVFEIGSITKQFTAVSILMLEEQEKLKVTDEITKYIPDYPTLGKKITIHHLLTHTSGIKSYTDMPSFVGEARTDLSPTELIDVFKNEPMDFDPGEKYNYSNSGYILLGYIIEVASGETYQDFIQKNIFDKVGMSSSYYGSNAKIIKNRASGYKEDGDSYANSDYISMSLPYAAGSIMSTTDDMLKWQNVINANTLIIRKSLEKAINGSTLNDGKEIAYGYGWGKDKVQGSTAIAHGGGIFGYTTHEMYMPKEKIYVVALTNCNCKNISGLTKKIAAIAIGKPYPNKKDAISLSASKLQKWVGAYKFDNEVIRHILIENNQLYSLREGGNGVKFEIYPMTENRFIFEEGTIEYLFSIEEDKKQVVFKVRGKEFIGKPIDKALPTAKKEIQLSTDILKQYIGKYELQPVFILDVTVDGDKIYMQATGQQKFEVFAEKEDHFFLKVVPASIEFTKNDKGIIDTLILNQGGRKMPSKKL